MAMIIIIDGNDVNDKGSRYDFGGIDEVVVLVVVVVVIVVMVVT